MVDTNVESGINKKTEIMAVKEIKKDSKEAIAAKYPQIEISETGYLHVPASNLIEVMRDLKVSFGFHYLSNITAVDYLSHINVVYNPCVAGTSEMLHIIVKIDRQKPRIPSMVPVWGGALWQEREVYDLVGVFFIDHPDLRRILLDDTWEDHPLLRDYQWQSGRD